MRLLAATALLALGALFGAIAIGTQGYRAAHRVFARHRAAARPLQPAPAPRLPRAARRRAVRLGHLRAGDRTRRARGARVDDGTPHARHRRGKIAPWKRSRTRAISTKSNG